MPEDAELIDAATRDEFRQEVRSWLMENLPEGWGTPEYVPPRTTREVHEAGQSWVRKLYDAGYTAMSFPKEYGGNERPEWQRRIIGSEMRRTGTPGGPSSNVLVAASAILQSGQEWQKKRFLAPMFRGDEAWVQGFSEPNAGSDLANVQTTAVRDGDEWVVNGQKVWNSFWEFADFGVVVVKTDMEAPRHRNLSYFIFDTKSPGYSARPLRQLTGGSEFCEMFFDNVRIPHENLLGEVNKGWYAAMATLIAERNMADALENVALPSGVGISSIGGMGGAVDLAKSTRRRGKTAWEDDSIRQRIAQCAIEYVALEHSMSRAFARLEKGIPMADEVSISKLFRSELQQRGAEVSFEILGAYSQLWRGPHSEGSRAQVSSMLMMRGMTILAGTSEICRNIIAERILGLPRVK